MSHLQPIRNPNTKKIAFIKQINCSVSFLDKHVRAIFHSIQPQKTSTPLAKKQLSPYKPTGSAIYKNRASCKTPSNTQAIDDIKTSAIPAALKGGERCLMYKSANIEQMQSTQAARQANLLTTLKKLIKKTRRAVFTLRVDSGGEGGIHQK